ncbi:LytTR family two component transcriptional regulator [Natranaerovirga pectinivora]|uniref:Stage 0 sporulation protein A homolog n=1 Tax=Natranaerovirga pectinivora TaxID=682400 RepID=A0A4R3MLD9_9FIRM|nr:LytTR family DNA-binding domain-containing protein [Natranaerovirga pectinivora]TCT15448.1 LytTR family two component transcriptional regulator [Natranaerovirga pectinivora]
MINILVVEDQEQQRRKLVRILRQAKYEANIFEAATGKEAVKIFNSHNIDLFFLDIQLPDISGLKIAEIIRSIPKYELTFMVIITTHIAYQLQSFKQYHCYDFIEKPYESKEVIEIANRLLKGIKVDEPSKEEDNIYFKLKNCIIKVKVDDILFIESQKRNCIIHTVNGLHIVPNMTMKDILQEISKSYFMKTHKSYIINIKKVIEVEKVDRNSWLVYFVSYNQPAFISNNFKDAFLEQLESEKKKYN